MFTLPAEVWSLILRDLRRAPLYSAALASRGLNALVTPSLYRTIFIDLNLEGVRNPDAVKSRSELVLRSFRERPNLCTLVRYLELHLPYEEDKVEVQIVQKLIMHVERLELLGYWTGSSLYHKICTSIAESQIETLALVCDEDEYHQSIIPTDSDGLVDLDRLHTWPMRHLDIEVRPWSQKSLEAFMSGPESLQSIHYITDSRYYDIDLSCPVFSVGNIQATLNRQRHSLQAVKIDKYQQDGANRFLDFSGFGKLENLEICEDNFFGSAAEVYGKMLAPKLERLCIDATDKASRATLLEGGKTDWIVDFCHFQQRTFGERSKLRELRIECRLWAPEEDDYHYVPESEYPWSNLEDMRSKLSDLGICVTWPDPEISKDDWHEMFGA